MTATKLTEPRRRGLVVLANCHLDGGAFAFRSNTTGTPGDGRPRYQDRLIYHQIADWLVAQGLAEAWEPMRVDGHTWFEKLRLSPAGVVLCREQGIEVDYCRRCEHDHSDGEFHVCLCPDCGAPEGQHKAPCT